MRTITADIVDPNSNRYINTNWILLHLISDFDKSSDLSSFTFLIVFALVTWTLSAYLIPMLLPGLAYVIYLSVAVVVSIILFGSNNDPED